MKKMLLIVFSFVIVMMSSGIALSAEQYRNGPYIGINAGAAFLTDSDLTDGVDTITASFDTGYALSFAAGYRYNMFRVEGEVGYQKNDFDKVTGFGQSLSSSGDVNCLSFLVNGYIDFVNSSPFTPYISAGLGSARIEVNDWAIGGINIGSDDATVFAYQFGAGVGYAINKNLTLDLKYRYFATEDPDFDGLKAEFASHNVYLGLRYNF